MKILEISKHKFERHLDNPKRFYIKDLSHGIRKIIWVGLWFFELRACSYFKPN